MLWQSLQEDRDESIITIEVLIKIDMIGPEAIHKHNCLSAERNFVKPGSSRCCVISLLIYYTLGSGKSFHVSLDLSIDATLRLSQEIFVRYMKRR